MNGVHDMGGMHGFGPIEREANEPYFHESWEAIVFAISQVVRRTHRLYNIDEFRRGIETMDPERYLAASYFERWLHSIETNLIEKGVITEVELTRRTTAIQDDSAEDVPRSAEVSAVARRPAPVSPSLTEAERAEPSRFAVGDRVVARNVHPAGHTRLPRYVRGKRGVIDRVRGIQVFPDTNAHGAGRNPQTVYSVRFTGDELWGESAEPGEMLYIDLWESYLRSDESDRDIKQ